MYSPYSPVLITPPTDAPVSLAEVKRQCRAEDFTDDDALLESLIPVAVSHLDGWTGIMGRCLINQTWALTFDGFVADRLRLPFDVRSITTINYVNAAGTSAELSSAVYVLRRDHLGPYVDLKLNQSWPSTDASAESVTVTFVAGFGSEASNVPANIRAACLLIVSVLYDARGDSEKAAGALQSTFTFVRNILCAPYIRRF